MSADLNDDRTARAKPFSAYHNPVARDDDTLLTDVGPGTPCGEYMRRYWQPFMLASELKDLPVTVRLLCEDLVAFRDRGGRIGLLRKHCVHRGASLEYGVIAERGIMCSYHGWHFDIDGTILATPAEPANSRICQNFTQGAYPVREANGMLWAYMGPPEAMPELPVYDTFTYPEGNRIVPSQRTFPVNWLQIVENAADPMHNYFLHAIVSQHFSTGFNVLPVLDFVETPQGYLSMATRRVNDFIFVRASDMILPNISQFTRGARKWRDEENFFIACATMRWAVPIDNHNTMSMGFTHINSRTQRLQHVRDDELGVGKTHLIGQTGDRPYQERQRAPGDWDALTGQGVVANRKSEHLATTDRGVVTTRRQLMRAIGAVEKKETPSIPRTYRGEPVRTYCHELVLRLPDPKRFTTQEEIGAFGRRAARIVVETDNLAPIEREKVAERRIRELLAGELVA